jgi:hypothetical protein
MIWATSVSKCNWRNSSQQFLRGQLKHPVRMVCMIEIDRSIYPSLLSRYIFDLQDRSPQQLVVLWMLDCTDQNLTKNLRTHTRIMNKLASCQDTVLDHEHFLALCTTNSGLIIKHSLLLLCLCKRCSYKTPFQHTCWYWYWISTTAHYMKGRVLKIILLSPNLAG